MAQSKINLTLQFRDALADLPEKELAEKIRKARIGAVAFVTLRENVDYGTFTEAVTDETAYRLDLLYKDIAGVDWTKLTGARYNGRYHRWTVTRGVGYRWQDALLGGSGDGAVERKLTDAGLFIH